MNTTKQIGRLQDYIRVTHKKDRQQAVKEVKLEMIKLLDKAKETSVTDLDTYLRNNLK